MTTYLTKAKELYASYFSERPIPCTQAEIRYLEQSLNLPLPQAFTEYLLWMGNGADSYAGSDFFYRPLFDLKEGVDDIFERNPGHPPLPKDAIVFFMHAGSHFMFICTSEGENPPVYFYNEGMTQFGKTADQFSTYFENHIKEAIRLKEEIKQLRQERLQRERDQKLHSF